MIMIDTDDEVCCPHCGSIDVLLETWDEYYVPVFECCDCGARWPEDDISVIDAGQVVYAESVPHIPC